MTTKQKVELIGKKPIWFVESIGVQVEILDVREAFGRTDLQIRPIAGTGKKWVSSDNVSKS